MHVSASFPGLSHVQAQASRRILRREPSFSESDVANIEQHLSSTELARMPLISGKQAAVMLQAAARYIDAEQADAMHALPAEEQHVVLVMQDVLELGAEQAIHRARAGTPGQALAMAARDYLDEHHPWSLTENERAVGVLDFLGKIARNEFSGDYARWAANVLNSGVRTGVIVAMTTVLRQLIGFHLEKALLLGEASLPERELIGMVALLFGAGLNLAGALRDERNHTATMCTRMARGSMCALSVASLMLVAGTGEPSVLGSVMSSFGIQTASYTLARDLVGMFFPVTDNCSGNVNAKGIMLAGGCYTLEQFLASEAMDAVAPHSGAGRVMAEAAAVRAAQDQSALWLAQEMAMAAQADLVAQPLSSHELDAKVRSAVAALQPDLAHDMTRGALNGVVEVADELLLRGTFRYFQTRHLKQQVRTQACKDRRDPDAAVAALPRHLTEGLRIKVGARVPDRRQITDQFLTLNAMRTSAFEIIVSLAATASAALEQTSLPAVLQMHAVHAVVAGAVALIYPPFVLANARPAAPAWSRSDSGQPPLHDGSVASELRRRYIRRHHEMA